MCSRSTGDMIKFSLGYPADPLESVAHCKPALLGCLAKCGPWHKGKRPQSHCYSLGNCTCRTPHAHSMLNNTLKTM